MPTEHPHSSDASASHGGEHTALSPEMLKALAHPLRQQLIELFRRQDYVRAADAAAQLGEPANNVSFHLRVLADAGLIVEAPEQGRDRRDRVWTAQPGAWSLGDPAQPVADEALGNTVLQMIAGQHADLVRRVVAWAPEYASGRDATVRGTFERAALRMTPTEFEHLLTRINEVIAEAKANRDASDPQARFYEIDIIAGDDTI